MLNVYDLFSRDIHRGFASTSTIVLHVVLDIRHLAL